MITPAGVCEEEPIGGKVRNGDQAKMMEDQGGSSRAGKDKTDVNVKPDDNSVSVSFVSSSFSTQISAFTKAWS